MFMQIVNPWAKSLCSIIWEGIFLCNQNFAAYLSGNALLVLAQLAQSRKGLWVGNGLRRHSGEVLWIKCVHFS